jgi:hypothetical protein
MFLLKNLLNSSQCSRIVIIEFESKLGLYLARVGMSLTGLGANGKGICLI